MEDCFKRKARNDLTLIIITIVFLFFLSATAVISDFVSLSRLASINKIIPLFIICTCLLTAYRILMKCPSMVWSPLPWFLGVCGMYYGFGPLLYHFGNPESIAYADTYYPVDEYMLFRTNILNMVGITTVLVGYQATVSLLPHYNMRNKLHVDFNMLKYLLLLLLAVGVPIKYFMSLPYQFGLLKWVVPGSIKYLSMFLPVSIVVLFTMIKYGMNKYKYMLYILIASELITGLMTFSKLDIIIVLLAVVLGMHICKPKIGVLIFGGIVIALLYAILTPFVTYGRIAYNLRGVPEVTQLVDVIKEYALEERGEAIGTIPFVQSWWTRLSYANAQSFAIDSFEKGNPGDTYSLIPYTLVPRILYPTKPIMTPGVRFNEIVTGYEHSSSSVGIFGEAYWNGGWSYVILTCMYVGFLYAIFSHVMRWHISNLRLGYLPVAFIGILMGLRPDDWFVATYVGSFVQGACLYLLIWGFYKLYYYSNTYKYSHII